MKSRYFLILLLLVAVSGCIHGRSLQRGTLGAGVGAGLGYAIGQSGKAAAAGAGAGTAAGLLFGLAEELFFPGTATQATMPVAPRGRFDCNVLETPAQRAACKRGQAETVEEERRADEERAYQIGRYGYWGWLLK